MGPAPRGPGPAGGRRPARPCKRERAHRGPLGEPPGLGAHCETASQPGTQRVGRVRFDAHWQGDGRIQVQGGPDARQRGIRPESGPLRDADPPGPDLCGRWGGRASNGQDRILLADRRTSGDLSASAGPAAGGRDGPRAPRLPVRLAVFVSAVMAVNGITTLQRGEGMRFAGQCRECSSDVVKAGPDVSRRRARLTAGVGVVGEVPLDQVSVVCRIQCVLICWVATHGRCLPMRVQRWSYRRLVIGCPLT